MEKKRILFISQEIMPYLPETEVSRISRELPQGIQERGKEIRVFMPKFGLINERRNQLHEVIRLSGMNLIINDTDHPLIIKVASIQSAKMQVYFIDNDEYFQRKAALTDKNDEEFSDNDERAVFFARGVIETIKKLRWAPDIIHCHGWLSSLVPIYIKKSYQNDPLFQDTKIIYSIYNNAFKKTLNADYIEKAIHQNIEVKDMELLKEPNFINVQKHAIHFSDAVIFACKDTDPDILEFVNDKKIPKLDYLPEDNFVDAYSDFYDQIIES